MRSHSPQNYFPQNYFPQIFAEKFAQIAADFNPDLRKSASFFCENLREMALRGVCRGRRS
ncbi:MAG: hypothetical protein DYG98_21900 [Haliscomenobacteraceae bacterium CHB4]|nr:hypothetical protein [Haliscomenobacteraceae bacterium CHB4]